MVEGSIKSAEVLVAIYKFKNKSSLDLDHIMCSVCNSWLTAPIYLVQSGGNLCGKCIELNEGISIRNLRLEELLKGSIYPCKYSEKGCTVFNSGIDVHKHESSCDYGMLSCFCEDTFENRGDLLEHLIAQHEMESILMKEPVAQIRINLHKEMKIQLFQLTMGKVVLIVIVSQNIMDNLINLKIWNGTNYQKSLTYEVIIYNPDKAVEILKCGNVFHNSLIFDTSNNIPVITSETRKWLAAKIYFLNYRFYEPFKNYFESLSGVITTTEGQRVLRCSECKKILKYQCYGYKDCFQWRLCPRCNGALNRQNVPSKPIWSFRLLPEDLIIGPCINAKDGCMHYVPKWRTKKHLKCCDIREKTTYKDLQKYCGLSTIVDPGFISHHEIIFEFKFQYSMKQGVTECKWSMRCVESNEDKYHYDFALEISFCGKTIRISSKTQLTDDCNVLYFDDEFKESPIFILFM